MIKYIIRAMLIALALWVVVSYFEIGFTDWHLDRWESSYNFFKVVGII